MPEPPTNRISHRDKDGQPLELLEWAKLYNDFQYRLVADTQLDDVLVRTMWEGLDAGGLGAGNMFHTGVRRGNHWEDVWAGEYPCTLIEAQAAHELVTAKIRNTPQPTQTQPPTH